MGVMQQFNEPNIITTSSDKLFNWARKNSLWPLQFGLACCAIEMMSYGHGPQRPRPLRRPASSSASPRQADVMIVSGTVSTKMAERMTRLYEQMPEPKWVIAMGACAISGGPFLDGYSVLMGADRVIPVDVYVPGCPPRPEALIFGIMTLQKKIERDKQVGYERPRPALVNEDGTINEYLPEREYTDISEGKAPRFENIRPLKRTYVFERKGMPPASQTDVGWIPTEVKKKLKEQGEGPRRPPKEKRRRRRPTERAAEERLNGAAESADAKEEDASVAVTLPEGDLEDAPRSATWTGSATGTGWRSPRSRATWCGSWSTPEIVPAVLATARETLGDTAPLVHHGRGPGQGSFELTYELLDSRGARVTGQDRRRGRGACGADGHRGSTRRPTGTSGRPTTCSGSPSAGHPDLRQDCTCGRTTSTTTRS